jgi:hypothetical protein
MKKTCIIDGLEWEELGPYCELCGAHMGRYYRPNGIPRRTADDRNKCFINPHKHESYGKNKCPKCKARYLYDEGDMLVLTKADYKAIRKVRGIK